MNIKKLVSAVVVGVLSSTAGATALTLEFASPNWIYNNDGPTEQVAWRVTVDDETDGVLTVDISIDAGSTATADILGFGFDTTLTGLTADDLTFVSSSTDEGLGTLYTDTLRCGNGCGFNGDGRTAFDYIVRAGRQGSSNGLMTALSFTIDVDSTFVLSERSFSRVGIRSQSLGPSPDGGRGSGRDINSTPNETSVVPLPASAWVLLAGIGMLGAAGRLKRKQS